MQIAAVRPMPAGLHRDAEPGVARGGHEQLHIGDVGRQRNGRGALYHREIPWGGCLAPAGMVGKEELALHGAGEGLEARA